MATWVHFDPIVAVQSKLEDSFTSSQSCGVLQCQLRRGSPPAGSTPSPSASAALGQTTCASHPATDTTPPGRTTTSASAALGQTTCAISSVTQRRTPLLLDVQLLRDAFQPDQVCSPSANGGAATEARSCRGTRASWARTPFTVCGHSLQQFSPGRHEAPPRPRRG